MKKEDVIFERKEFLNLPGHNGMANVVAQITIDGGYKRNNDDYRHTYCKLDFADCDRRVSMDIDLDDAYSRENAIHKLDVLVDVLTEYRKVLIKEAKFQDRLEKRRDKKKAEAEAKEKSKAKEKGK